MCVHLCAHEVIGTVLSLFCGDRQREKFRTGPRQSHAQWWVPNRTPRPFPAWHIYHRLSLLASRLLFCLWMQRLLLCLHNFCEMLSVSPADTAEPFLDHFCLRMLSAYMVSEVWTKSLRDFLVLCLSQWGYEHRVVSSFMWGNSCLQKKILSHTKEL